MEARDPKDVGVFAKGSKGKKTPLLFGGKFFDEMAMLLPMSTLDELTPTVDHLPVKNVNLFHNSDMSNVDYFS